MTARAFPLVLLSLLTACSGESGTLDCSFEACGGDPVGTWTVAESCADYEYTNPSCPEMTVDDVEINLSGTLTIEADGTYARSFQSMPRFTYTFPASCLQPFMSCAEIDDDVFTCTGTPDTACTCVGTESRTTTDSGTWTASGNILSFEGFDTEFCVQGSVLKIRQVRDGYEIISVSTR